MKLKKLVELLKTKKELNLFLSSGNGKTIFVTIYRKKNKNYMYRRLYFGKTPGYKSLKEMKTDNILRYIRNCYQNNWFKTFKIKG